MKAPCADATWKGGGPNLGSKLGSRFLVFSFFFAPRLRPPARASAAGPAPRVASLRVAASSVADSVPHNFFIAGLGPSP